MKKLLAMLLTLTLLLALTACGGSKEAPKEEVKEETPVEDVVIEPEVVDPDADKPAEPSEEPEVAPEMPTVGEENEETLEEKPEEKPADKPAEESKSEEKPVTPEEKPAETESKDLESFYYALYDNLYPADAEGNPTGPFVMDMGMDAEIAEGFYPGLPALAKQLHIYMPAMTGVPYEVVLIEVSNASDVDAAKAALQVRIDTEKQNQMNYPSVQENWSLNSRIVVNGNCILMAVTSDCDAYVDAFNGLFA